MIVLISRFANIERQIFSAVMVVLAVPCPLHQRPKAFNRVRVAWKDAAYAEAWQRSLFGPELVKQDNEQIAAAFRDRLSKVAGFGFVRCRCETARTRSCTIGFSPRRKRSPRKSSPTSSANTGLPAHLSSAMPLLQREHQFLEAPRQRDTLIIVLLMSSPRLPVPAGSCLREQIGEQDFGRVEREA